MQFKKGVTVKDDAGNKAGEVDRVVIDPHGGQVTHIVVRKGFLFGTDKVIPIDMVRRTADDEVILNVDKDRLNDLPDFIDVNFVPLNEQEMGRTSYEGDVEPVYWYPVGGASPLMWGAGIPGMNPGMVSPFPYRVDEKENIPKGEVALKEGAKVLGSDGQTVGEVEKVLTEDQKDRITGLLVTKGTLNRHKRIIPVNWIKRIKEDGVELAVTAGFVENLKDYEG